jgi:ATP/maltotriose-dependent transcriptional regulator MalT
LVCARLGWLALSEGQENDAQRLLARALAIFRKVGEVRGAVMVQLGLSRVAIEAGHLARAADCHLHAELAARQQGDRPAMGAALAVRAQVALGNGNTAAAVAALHQARSIQVLIGHATSLGVVTLDLADAQRRRGDSEAAAVAAAEALDIFNRVGASDFAEVGRRALARARD